MINIQKIIPLLKNIIIEANNEIMEIYGKDFKIFDKIDKSPLTEADIISNDIIIKGLLNINKKISKDILIISEENKKIDYDIRSSYDYLWIVDPIDGTKEFIKKNGEFTTNIGLVYKNKVIFGIVGIPTLNEIYLGGNNVQSIKFNYIDNKIDTLIPREDFNPYIIAKSRSHMNIDTLKCISDIKYTYNNVITITSGSSIKMLLVANGQANFYPRYTPTNEWDTCAAHGVLKGVGKNLLSNVDNKELLYNKASLLNSFFYTN